MPFCKECTRLIVLYRGTVEQRRAFVDRALGAVGDDALVASRKAYELMAPCLEAADSVLRHIKEKHLEKTP